MSHSSAEKMRPQSGSHTGPAPGTRAHDDEASAQQPQTSVHPVEPEDPKAISTSDAQKRALDLNVGGHGDGGQGGHPGHQAEEHSATAAGQHATGSFTDKKSSS